MYIHTRIIGSNLKSFSHEWNMFSIFYVWMWNVNPLTTTIVVIRCLSWSQNIYNWGYAWLRSNKYCVKKMSNSCFKLDMSFLNACNELLELSYFLWVNNFFKSQKLVHEFFFHNFPWRKTIFTSNFVTCQCILTTISTFKLKS